MTTYSARPAARLRPPEPARRPWSGTGATPVELKSQVETAKGQGIPARLAMALANPFVALHVALMPKPPPASGLGAARAADRLRRKHAAQARFYGEAR